MAQPIVAFDLHLILRVCFELPSTAIRQAFDEHIQRAMDEARSKPPLGHATNPVENAAQIRPQLAPLRQRIEEFNARIAKLKAREADIDRQPHTATPDYATESEALRQQLAELSTARQSAAESLSRLETAHAAELHHARKVLDAAAVSAKHERFAEACTRRDALHAQLQERLEALAEKLALESGLAETMAEVEMVMRRTMGDDRHITPMIESALTDAFFTPGTTAKTRS